MWYALLTFSPCCNESNFAPVPTHRNLYEQVGILRRGISVGYIMRNPTEAPGNRGFLIDLDHAVEINVDSDYAKYTTGVVSSIHLHTLYIYTFPGNPHLHVL